MRKILQKTFGENLEVFELAKLQRKYEALGFKFHTDLRRKGVILDAIAKHPETKEEIIFEIKRAENFRKGDTEKILQKRNEYLKLFPKASFVFVLARETKEYNIPDSEFNFLLLNFIEEKHIKHIKRKINGFIKLASVKDIVHDNLDFGSFKSINVTGYANLKFWVQIEEKEIRGEFLSDGLPFAFDIKLVFKPGNSEVIYEIGSDSKIDFDFSEFK